MANTNSHRGGRKRLHKKKGRTPQSKTYNEHCRVMIESGKMNEGNGKWVNANVENMRSRGIWSH